MEETPSALLARLLWLAGAVPTKSDGIDLAFVLLTVMQEEGYILVPIPDYY